MSSTVVTWRDTSAAICRSRVRAFTRSSRLSISPRRLGHAVKHLRQLADPSSSQPARAVSGRPRGSLVPPPSGRALAADAHRRVTDDHSSHDRGRAVTIQKIGRFAPRLTLPPSLPRRCGCSRSTGQAVVQTPLKERRSVWRSVCARAHRPSSATAWISCTTCVGSSPSS